MQKFGEAVVKHRIPILIICFLLLIPSIIGMMNMKINYDMLNYLPSNLETVKGQDILLDQFGKGAFSFIIVDGMEPKDVSALKEKIKTVKHVDSVIWYDDLANASIPMDILPSKYYNDFNNGSATLMAVFFDTSTSDSVTMDAITQIRSITGNQCFVSGLSAMVTDLRNLCEKEEPIYVAIAVILACAVMMLCLDSWLAPIIFLIGIGMAILYNFGTNFIIGDVSYITKALSAVLQLAVTMDLSIFLWNSYCEEKGKTADHEKAMVQAIANTMRSIMGSSLTLIAGFLALCFMSYTLGFNIGIIMAKGVLLGVAGCATILPSLILVLDKPLEKTIHKALLPKMEKLWGFVSKRSWIFLVVFVLLVFPAFYGYLHTEKYYQLSRSLPDDMACKVADSKLSSEFNIGTTHMALVNSNLSQKDTKQMIDKLKAVDGVNQAIGLDSVLGSDVPEDMVPKSVKDILQNGNYKLLLVNTQYKVASNEVKKQLDDISSIIKSYDSGAMLIGEASCTEDMIKITDTDFKVVDIISIVSIFIIIALVLKSISLPVVLVAAIEFAIFINLGIPFYSGTALPFITPICISTIQLGSTVDYAILMTNRYVKERRFGLDKHEAARISLSTSAPPVMVSALGFFAATFGVAMYSKVDMISSMCLLIGRGALISMLCVIFILPALFILFDKVIMKTTWLYKKDSKKVNLFVPAEEEK